ncbi:HNH endonuclease [Mycobacterium phage Skinny]|nr:HNH endonuclease [Mycobacterium phage Skinny]
MKTCNKCKQDKPVDQFNKNRSNADGLQRQCRDCQRDTDREHYSSPARKAQVAANRDKARAQARTYVTEWLTTHPCVDCGEADIIVLEFDHVTGTKVRAVSEMVDRGCRVATIAAEIAKCEVRCANCHRRVTYNRRLGEFR